MFHAVYLLLAYAAFVVQLGFGDALTVAGARPNLLAVGLCGCLVAVEDGRAVAWGAGLGLLADVLTPHPLGIATLLFATLAWIGLHALLRLRSAPLTRLMTLLLVLWAACLLPPVVRGLFETGQWQLTRHLGAALGDTAYSAVLGGALLLGAVPVRLLFRRRSNSGHGWLHTAFD